AGGAATVGGTPAPGSDPTPPTNLVPGTPPAPAPGPLGVAVDRAGAVFVANSPENRIDKAPADMAPTAGGAALVDAVQPTDPSALCQLAEAPDDAALRTSSSWMARTVSVSAKAAAPGQEVGLQGNGFGPGQHLTVTLCSVPTVLGAVTADPQGHYRANVKIPADAAPGAHHLVLADASGNAAVAFDVIQASRGAGTPLDQPATDTGDGTTDGSNTDLSATDPGSTDTTDTVDPSAGDTGSSSDSTDSGITGAGSTDGTDSSGMPNTGADFVPMIYLAGMSIKLGGALVVAGRRKSPTG
ncbi:MAG: hypothetical protein ACR2GF_02130, partial [Acidimicrobiales bacterium]